MCGYRRMIMEIFADARELMHDRDLQFLQMILRTDPGAQQ